MVHNCHCLPLRVYVTWLFYMEHEKSYIDEIFIDAS